MLLNVDDEICQSREWLKVSEFTI